MMAQAASGAMMSTGGGMLMGAGGSSSGPLLDNKPGPQQQRCSMDSDVSSASVVMTLADMHLCRCGSGSTMGGLVAGGGDRDQHHPPPPLTFGQSSSSSPSSQQQQQQHGRQPSIHYSAPVPLLRGVSGGSSSNASDARLLRLGSGPSGGGGGGGGASPPSPASGNVAAAMAALTRARSGSGAPLPLPLSATGRSNSCGGGGHSNSNNASSGNSKGQGYRRLWQAVSRVQRGERLGDAPGGAGAGGLGGLGGEGVTVEDLVRAAQQLPPAASAVEALGPSLSYLDSRAVAALLKGLAKAGLGGRAVELFDHVRALPPEHDLAALADVFTYTTMISQCNSHHQLRRALELVAEMRSRAVPLNVHTYSALLNVCLKANELDLAHDVHAQMLAEGVAPNLVTYNTLLDVYGKQGRWADALAVLELLRHGGVRPEARTYNAVMACCNAAGRHAEAARVHEAMLAAGVEPNGASFSAALAAHARSGQLDAAMGLFHEMAARGYERGTNTYAAVLAACEGAGRWDLALELLQQMQADGVRPNAAVLTAAVGACLQGGEPERAEAVFEAMQPLCRPDAATFNCLVAVYAALNKHREAAATAELMLRGGQHVELQAYDAAIEACWASGVLPLQAYALRLHARAAAHGFYAALVSEEAAAPPADGGGGGDTGSGALDGASGAGGGALDVQLPPGPPHVALIGLLCALRDLRDELAGGGGGQAAPACVRLRLATQGHDPAALVAVVETTLQGLGSPFAPAPGTAALAAAAASLPPSPSTSGPLAGLAMAAPPPLPAELEWSAGGAAAIEWLRSRALAVALGALALTADAGRSGGAMLQQQQQPGGSADDDGAALAQDDASRELKCRQAMAGVRAYEAAANGGPAAAAAIAAAAATLPRAALLERGDLVRLLLAGARCLGLGVEVGHDAAALLDRALLGTPYLANALSGRLIAAGCLAAAGGLDMGASQLAAALFQVQPAALLMAASQVRSALGGSVALSSARVLRLLLERLGVDADDAPGAPFAAGQALALADAAAASPAFAGAPPTAAAAAVLYAARAAAGLLPLWPPTLAALTGFASAADARLVPYATAAMQIVLDAAAAAAAAAAAGRAATP